ncbi:MAG TPA: VanZ family protein [Parasegetibacter sp.]
MRKQIISFLPAISWSLLIIVLLSIPGNELPDAGPFTNLMLDKWAHIFLFLILTALFCYPLKSRVTKLRTRFMVRIVIVSSIFGIIMEFVQHYFVPKRSFELGDIVADIVGAVAGFLIMRKYFHKVKPGLDN